MNEEGHWQLTCAQKRELIAAAKEAKEREWEERMDIVRQIRALETVKPKRDKTFDPTESASVGLLEEMPLAELKERLALVKVLAMRWVGR